jgi:putative peptidoglycan lipid II flippase
MFLAAAGRTSLLPGASLAALFYAERLLEFPLGICGAAIGMAAAPRLAEAATADAGRLAVRDTLGRTLKLAWLCNAPAAAGLMAVSLPLSLALFGHGAFDAEAARTTALLLCAYAPGLPAYAASRPLLTACHALADRHTPLYALAGGLSAALILGWALLDCGQAGPPLGASAGLWVYVLILGLGTRRACGGLSVSWRGLCPALGGSLLTYWCAARLSEAAADPLAALLVAVPGGIGVYMLTVCVLDASLRRGLARALHFRGGSVP